VSRRRIDELARPIGRAMPGPGEADRSPAGRCRDCKRERELTRPLLICRECAGKRDRSAGLYVDDEAWKGTGSRRTTAEPEGEEPAE
jgi:hypothetical protein